MSLSLLRQSIKHFPLHFHHFMPLLLIPNVCQLASQGVPLILSASHFMASSKMDGMTLESFITWSMHHSKQTNISHCWPSQSRIFRCIFTISWHFYYYQTHFNWLLRVSPWYCQRAISWPHRKWMAWHLSPSSHEACVKTNKQISLSLRTQSIKHFPLHFHHFMPLLLIPNAFQLASQGVPLILSTSHFMASSKMDGMTLESFITWSMHQAKQTNISFTAGTVNQAFSAAFSPSSCHFY